MDQRSVRDILAGKTYFIRTFGCQMNQHDSERVSGLLDSYGCLMALDPEHADIVVFMTCCVREAADTRLYGQCNSCKSLPPSPSGKRVVAVGGCIAQRDGEGLLTNVDNVNVIFGTHSIAHVAELIAEAFLDGKRHIRTNEHEDTDAMSMPWHRETQYHAWVPIMTGCNNFCTYCIVPYVRGRERSRQPEDIEAELRCLVEEGYKDITLLGQNVNSYGKDLGIGMDFSDLLARLDAVPGEYRLRFMTSHPKDASEKLFRTMAEGTHISQQLHLPFQSGSNEILKRMNRGYTKEAYLSLLAAAKTYMPDLVLSSDIIVGFPGETEEDFQGTLDVVRQGQYDQLFTFLYSKRSGTPAAEMPDAATQEEKQDRFNRLLAAQEEINQVRQDAYQDRELSVLIDGLSNGKDDSEFTHCGRTDGGLLVLVSGEDLHVGDFVDVVITKTSLRALYGRAVRKGYHG